MGDRNIHGDALTRLFGRQNFQYLLTNSLTLGFDYQIGGKKYLNGSPRDNIINYANVFSSYKYGKGEVRSDIFAKIKREQGAVEDFAHVSWGADGDLLVSTPWGDWQPYANARASQFAFSSQPLYTYRSILAGTGVRHPLGPVTLRLDSSYQRLSFLHKTVANPRRADNQYETAIGITGTEEQVFDLRVGFQRSKSNLSGLSYYNVLCNGRYSYFLPLDIVAIAYFSIQSKRYAKRNLLDSEGVRLLRTSSEDENFNNISLALSRRVWRFLSLEGQYQRFSNELSDREMKYRKNVYQLGLRGAF